ncbi:MAG: hypothetical protein P8Y94_14600 [Acidobacteriota bacterium]
MNPLDHTLQTHLPNLCAVDSSAELQSLPLYRQLKPSIDGILGFVLTGEGASGRQPLLPHLRATAWNIERGIELRGIIEAIRQHPTISVSDLLLGQEYAQSQGVQVPFAIEGAHSIALPNGKDKMRGKEKRLGCQRAVIAIVEHPFGRFRAVSVHLDAHSTQKHRMRQMRLVLDDLDRFHPELPVLVGGDWNTSTYNSRTALFSILGYVRRVLMGVRHVIRSHYPYPDRWFERHLFREIERRGYVYRELNEPGACTLHYDVADLAANGRMADWIPNWCFWFINWALAKNDGRCSFKLDWFAAKGIEPVAEYPPHVVTDVSAPDLLLSDHDPIVLDFRLV